MQDTQPDTQGYFGAFGGRFVPETLMSALFELEETWNRLSVDTGFRRELAELSRTYVGRPTALFHARRLSEHTGGGRLWLKREDLNHTGAHKINNALGQALLARAMGKHRIIAERLISQGTLTTSPVHPRGVFGPAMRAAAAAVVLLHNHPSGDASPSADDLEITRRLADVGDLVGIQVLDHVIIGDGRYVSLADRGLLR